MMNSGMLLILNCSMMGIVKHSIQGITFSDACRNKKCAVFARRVRIAQMIIIFDFSLIKY